MSRVKYMTVFLVYGNIERNRVQYSILKCFYFCFRVRCCVLKAIELPVLAFWASFKCSAQVQLGSFEQYQRNTLHFTYFLSLCLASECI